MAKKEIKSVAKKPELKKVKSVEDFYSIGKWKGFDQFKCDLCAFDSLEEKVIKVHITKVHMPKPVKPKVKVQLYDRFNNKVN